MYVSHYIYFRQLHGALARGGGDVLLRHGSHQDLPYTQSHIPDHRLLQTGIDLLFLGHIHHQHQVLTGPAQRLQYLQTNSSSILTHRSRPVTLDIQIYNFYCINARNKLDKKLFNRVHCETDIRGTWCQVLSFSNEYLFYIVELDLRLPVIASYENATQDVLH